MLNVTRTNFECKRKIIWKNDWMCSAERKEKRKHEHKPKCVVFHHISSHFISLFFSTFTVRLAFPQLFACSLFAARDCFNSVMCCLMLTLLPHNCRILCCCSFSEFIYISWTNVYVICFKFSFFAFFFILLVHRFALFSAMFTSISLTFHLSLEQ